MSTLARMKNYLLAAGMETFLPVLTQWTPGALVGLIDQLRRRGIERMKGNHRGTPDELQRKVDAANAFFEMAKRTLPRLSKNTQRRLAFNAFFNAINLGEEKREEYRQKHGEFPPFFVLMSPSMACDLRCYGCYAWKHPKDRVLSREDVSRVIREGKEDMGIYFYSFTGGEPTYWPHLEDIAREHEDCFFQIYTHGQRIDEDMARRFALLGNIYPAISIEGDEAVTDARRGPGAHARVLESMDHLRKHGVLFGFSLTHTAANHEYGTSEAFIDAMIERGAAFGWLFQYIPVGRDPQMDLVPSAQQRRERRERVHAVRRDKPILVYDFWNDGDAVDGCIAWGRKYVHITASGYVEPCVFVHFAKDSIHEKSMGECLRSDAFREARRRQPFTDDLRRPCPQIDHPEVLKDLVEKYGLVPTHEGAEDIVGAHFGSVCRTARAYEAELARADAAAGACACACGCG